MKIDSKQSSEAVQGTRPMLSATRRGRGPSTTMAESADALSLSARAEEFRRVRPQLETLTESRQERIARVTALVQNKAYRVSSEQIAEAMLRDESTADVLGLGRLG